MAKKDPRTELTDEMERLSAEMIRLQYDIRDTEQAIEQARATRPPEMIAKAETRLAEIKRRIAQTMEKQALIEMKVRNALGGPNRLN